MERSCNMTVTFFGHSDFFKTVEYAQAVQQILEEKCKSSDVTFLLGSNGNFDSFAYSCAKKYKEKHTLSKLVFVTPYIEESYLKKRAPMYDETIFPDIENTLRHFRIHKRNEYMVRSSDFIIAYVAREYGGAYKAVEYAKKKQKEIINLAKT